MRRNYTSLTQDMIPINYSSLRELTDAWHGLYGLVPEPRQVEGDAEDEDADDGRLGERHPDDFSGSQWVNYGKISAKQMNRDV